MAHKAPDRALKISVLLITYNHAPFIEQAIESVLAQETSSSFELVIGDDCSSDGTRTIVREYASRYPERIRLVLPETTMGLGGNRIFLEILRACRGTYVAFLDGDDFWTAADKLQTQADFLDAHESCALCFHDVTVFDHDGRWPPYRWNTDAQKPLVTTSDLLSGNVIQTCSAMARRSLYAELPPWVEQADPQDWALYLIASRHGDVAYVARDMGAYRRHSGAIWQARSPEFHLERAADFLNGVRQHDIAPGHETRVHAELLRCHGEAAISYEQNGDYAHAAQHLERWLALDHVGPAAGPIAGRADLTRWLTACRRNRDNWFRGLITRLRVVLAGTAADWTLFGGVAARRIARVLVGGPIGYLWVEEGGRASGGSVSPVSLAWTSRGARKLAVRVHTSSGPLLSAGGAWGRETTGNWVSERTRFFLQDESSHETPASTRTLAVIRAGDPHAMGASVARRLELSIAAVRRLAARGWRHLRPRPQGEVLAHAGASPPSVPIGRPPQRRYAPPQPVISGRGSERRTSGSIPVHHSSEGTT